MGCSLPGSSVCGIFQARLLEWVVLSFSYTYTGYLASERMNLVEKHSQHQGIQAPTHSSLIIAATTALGPSPLVYEKVVEFSLVKALVTQSCPTLCNPMDCSPSGSCVPGCSPGKNTEVGSHSLLQENLPTQGLNPGLQHCRQILFHLNHQGSPCPILVGFISIK